MGENYNSTLPTIVYGFILVMSSIAFRIIEKVAIVTESRESDIAKTVTSGKKEVVSTLGYIIGILAALVEPIVGIIIYYAIALIWLVPDKRIERYYK
ncbi:hypothetical protein [Pseudopedobacter sp.]|uniref:hypothetical protein n=1 Tax=Pseudopedobacter sp. TaxID=1936787 RepID=UPI0033429C74